MQNHDALFVDAQAFDQELTDVGTVGPELAHLAKVYCSSPRAIVFRQPSSEWRLFMLVLPLASRLSLLSNPVFTQLTRAWGLNLRFVGVDRNGLAYDFRSLLSNDMLHCLIEWLRAGESQRLQNFSMTSADGQTAKAQPLTDNGLDILFSGLAREMLTVLDKRRDDWGRHLNAHDRLEPGLPNNLFDRSSRYPDFLAACRDALKNQVIDVHFYGRILRSIDLREQSVELRAGAQIEDCLDPVVMTKLNKAGAGKHLGCYNWLSLSPTHASMRSHILANLPSFASYFAESLLNIETWHPTAQTVEDLYSGMAEIEESFEQEDLQSGAKPQPPAYDLRRISARQETLKNTECAARLRRAIDAGQDRAVIQVLAERFEVSENTIRLLWRDKPETLGQPPTWHLAEILRQLDALGRHDWPAHSEDWETLMSQSVPVEAT
ncbi:MAG: hypothetical protein AB8C46_15020 [Burkholderiaceae bacterium]